MLGPHAADIAPNVKKLMFNQNSYYTFLEHSFDPNELAAGERVQRVGLARRGRRVRRAGLARHG